jgi:hypothetical protein
VFYLPCFGSVAAAVSQFEYLFMHLVRQSILSVQKTPNQLHHEYVISTRFEFQVNFLINQHILCSVKENAGLCFVHFTWNHCS